MARARAAKRSGRPARRVTLEQVLEDVRKLRASSVAVYDRVIRDLGRRRSA